LGLRERNMEKGSDRGGEVEKGRLSMLTFGGD